MFSFIKAKRDRKAAQNNLKNYQARLHELQKAEEEAKHEFKEIWNIPYAYWDDHALTKILQYIENYEESNWERATDLYKEDEYRSMMLANAQMTLEEARVQTEIARQTRNAARSAAFGAWATAAGIWRIGAKL